jgi:hypothetical protein
LSLEFALKKGAVRWSDLSLNRGIKLLPEAKGKDKLAAHYLPWVSNQDGAHRPRRIRPARLDQKAEDVTVKPAE